MEGRVSQAEGLTLFDGEVALVLQPDVFRALELGTDLGLGLADPVDRFVRLVGAIKDDLGLVELDGIARLAVGVSGVRHGGDEEPARRFVVSVVPSGADSPSSCSLR
jgi:hypothetical protein